LTFDEDTFVKKYLNTKGKIGSEGRFRDEVATTRGSFGDNHKLQIRGHDFIELLLWLLRKLSYRAYDDFSVDTLQHCLLSQLQAVNLARENLFAGLLQKYAGATP
jgi:hypothetical protein